MTLKLACELLFCWRLQIASWLSVPPTGLRQYGDELRPCKLTTHVKGYNPSKNDFLFERRLNDHVYTIVKEYSKGRPALVFCRYVVYLFAGR